VAVINPGGSPPDNSPPVSASWGKLGAEVGAFVARSLIHLEGSALLSWLAGLGLGQYHVSVPFLASWLLGWVGLEGTSRVSSAASAAYLTNRKSVALTHGVVNFEGAKTQAPADEAGGYL
jgi:hypothetical protein